MDIVYTSHTPTASLQRSYTKPPTIFLDIALNCLMLRHQSRSVGEC